MRTFKNLLLVLSTGYIFVYFSEHLFWARLRPGDSLIGWLGAWLAYSLLAYLFLALVTFFRVKNRWALFLAGAAFGWLAEGVIVQTAYESLPLSISFTGLAWHALITVWLGWSALRQTIRAASGWAALKLASLWGLFFGLWAISWWLEPDGGVSPLPEFAAFALTTTLLVMFACWLADWSVMEPFSLNRWTLLVVSGLFVLYFCFVTVPAAPLAALILPILLGLVYWGLRQNRRAETEAPLLTELGGPAPLWQYLSLLALPAASVLVYALALTLDLRWQTNWILYLITTPLGFILFGLSLYRVWKRPLADGPG